jgi:hypothetical protein
VEKERVYEQVEGEEKKGEQEEKEWGKEHGEEKVRKRDNKYGNKRRGMIGEGQ